MKLVTDVKPRADGTVAAFSNGNRYVFKDEGGRLVCEVGSKADADALLDTGNFYPATESDAPIEPPPPVDNDHVAEGCEQFGGESQEPEPAPVAEKPAKSKKK